MGVLRLLLAISVVTVHCGPFFNISFVGGTIAVQAFYIISGFYMTLILNEKYILKNNSYKLFISNRLLRLYPIYFVVLLIVILFSVITGLSTENNNYLRLNIFIHNLGAIDSMIFIILSNLIILGQDLFLFFAMDPISGHLVFTSNYATSSPALHNYLLIPQAWTLGIEISFYLLAPFILRRNWKVILTIIILSLSLRFYIHYGLNLRNDPWTYRFFPSELMFFLLGYFSYFIAIKLKTFQIKSSINYFIFIFILLFSIFYFQIPTFGFPESFKAISFFITIVLGIPFLFNFFKNNKWDGKIGELSYPVYISHVSLFMILSYYDLNSIHSGIYVTLIAVLFSLIINKLLADPIEKFRQSRIKV